MLRLRTVCVLIPLAFVVLLLSPVASLGEDMLSELYELYARTARLSLRGVETRELEELLASAVDSIESGDYGTARGLLSEARRLLSELEGRADAIVLGKNLAKYGTAAAVLSIPPLVYMLLPRLYVYLWYTARKNWVVTYERSR